MNEWNVLTRNLFPDVEKLFLDYALAWRRIRKHKIINIIMKSEQTFSLITEAQYCCLGAAVEINSSPLIGN